MHSPSTLRTGGRSLALLLVLTLVLAACTGTDDPDDVEEGAASTEEAGTGAATEGADGTGGETADVARTWLADTYGLDATVIESLELADVTASPGVQHVRFAQTVDGIEVVDAEITVHVLDSGEVQSATDDLVVAEPGESSAAVDEARALDVATKAVTGVPTGDPAISQVWLPNGPVLQLAWSVEVATEQPTSSWTVLVDAATGQVLSAEQATFGMQHGAAPAAPGAVVVAQAAQDAQGRAVAQGGGDACEVSPPGACVFLPDPIYAAGGDLASPDQANQFLTAVELQGLDDPTALVGEFVDTEPQGVPIEPTRESDSTWATGRAGRGFEAAMVYYWIDRVQRHIQRLGFTDVLAGPFPVIPIDPDVVDNAFYSPAEGAIHMGVGSDGIHEGEDAAGIVHEYGHAVLDAQAPGLIGSAEGGAYHESFGDLLAFLTSLEHRTGDIGCLFAWPEEGQCLRRLDSDKTYPDDVVNEVHLDGEIYNGAVYDVTAALLEQEGLALEACPGTQDCAAVADRVLTTILASNTYLSNDPSLPDVAEAFLLANDAVSGGADADVITAAFAAHGLTGGGDSMVDGGGEAMTDGGGVALSLDITHSYRGDLEVVAGVLGPDSTDLCEPIELATPDESDDSDNLIGDIDVSDTDCAAFVPPSPEQVWYLQVTDTLPEDEGQINGFSVVVEGVPWLASGLPQPIGDADPEGTVAFVAGPGEDTQSEGMSEMTDTVDGDGPVMSIDIAHTYVGDLDITAGVADAEGTITCSVHVLEPDPSNAEDTGVAGDVDLSACAGSYPPGPDQRWFLLVIDTAAEDVGTVEALSLTGPDGQTFDLADVPVEIPDADVDGIALLLDGSGGGSSGQAGGGGTTADITASVQVTHTYQGDLAVTAGALTPDGDVLCEVVLASPDQANDAADLAVDASLADCARHYPPTPDQPWFLFVADTLELDTGTLDGFTLTGPDGTVFAPTDLPQPIPDADPDGVLVLLDGSEAGGAPGSPGGEPSGDVVGSVEISHPYIGDLAVNVGVTDAQGQVLCEQSIRTPDVADDGDDLSGEVAFGDCSGLWPPAPDRVFYLEVIDEAAADAGEVISFSVRGPDGQVFDATGLPAPIPDADPSGVVVGIG